MCVVAVQRRGHICFGKLDITLFFRLFVGLLWCMLFNSYLKVDKCFKKIQCFIISTIICFHQIFFHRNLCSSKKFHQKNSRDENEASTGHPASSSSHTASVNLRIMFFFFQIWLIFTMKIKIISNCVKPPFLWLLWQGLQSPGIIIGTLFER